MESRNITLTICGEWLDFSPRDRKAVCKIDDLFKLTGNIPLVSYPLYNLIPVSIHTPTQGVTLYLITYYKSANLIHCYANHHYYSTS